MWCTICQKNVIDCVCPDIEERLNAVRGTAVEPAAEINLVARKMKEKAKSKEKGGIVRKGDNKLIEVCSECLMASCWYHEFMCDNSWGAGTVLKTKKELRKLKREHSDNWSNEKLKKVYGTENPFGYKEE